MDFALLHDFFFFFFLAFFLFIWNTSACGRECRVRCRSPANLPAPGQSQLARSIHGMDALTTATSPSSAGHGVLVNLLFKKGRRMEAKL